MKALLAMALLGVGVSCFGPVLPGAERILCEESPNAFSECARDVWLRVTFGADSDSADPSLLQLEDFVPGRKIHVQVELFSGFPARGWVYRVEHDTNVLALEESSVTIRGTRLEALLNGGGFESTRATGNGFESSVQLPASAGENLPHESAPMVVSNASYTLVSDPGPTGTEIRFGDIQLGRHGRVTLPHKVFDGVLRTGEARPSFQRGDLDGDGEIHLTDPIRLLGVLLGGQELSYDCEAAADSDADGTINLSDVIVLLSWMFKGGSSLADPFLTCGEAPADGAECRESSPACERS